jgi:hypothetical protein
MTKKTFAQFGEKLLNMEKKIDDNSYKFSDI